MRIQILTASLSLSFGMVQSLSAAVNFKPDTLKIPDLKLAGFSLTAQENRFVESAIRKYGSAGALSRECRNRKAQSQHAEACVAVSIVKKRIRLLTGSNWKLVQAIAFTENRINHNSPEVDTSLKSHADAKGLMQVTKLIWNFYVNSTYSSGKFRKDGHHVLGDKPLSFDGRAPYGLNNSIIVGNAFLTNLKSKYCGKASTVGCRQLVAAAYNAGEPNVDKHDGIPPFKETRQYVRIFDEKYAMAD